MEWGSVVLAVQILLLIAGWLLFQQAKSDLTARAAQVPVLSEVKALQKSVAGLLEQLKLESGQISAQLEARCLEARDLLSALDRRMEGLQQPAQRAAVRRKSASEAPSARAVHDPPSEPPAPSSLVNPRHLEVYALADNGLSTPMIAQNTGISEGEVELILGLRPPVS